MTSEQLLAELTNDSAQIGYAGMSIHEKLAAINSDSESTYLPVLIPPATVMTVLRAFTDRINAVADAELRSKLQFKWGQFAATLRSLTVGLDVLTVPFGAQANPAIEELQTGVTEGVIVQGEIDVLLLLGRRKATRAEELWGEGTIVTLNDLALIVN